MVRNGLREAKNGNISVNAVMVMTPRLKRIAYLTLGPTEMQVDASD